MQSRCCSVSPCTRAGASPSAYRHLSTALWTNSSLVNMSIAGGDLSPWPAALCLSMAIMRHQPSLTSLNISRCRLPSLGFSALLKAAATSGHLQKLHFSGVYRTSLVVQVAKKYFETESDNWGSAWLLIGLLRAWSHLLCVQEYPFGSQLLLLPSATQVERQPKNLRVHVVKAQLLPVNQPSGKTVHLTSDAVPRRVRDM